MAEYVQWLGQLFQFPSAVRNVFSSAMLRLALGPAQPSLE
jgi:hypothetical protein